MSESDQRITPSTNAPAEHDQDGDRNDPQKTGNTGYSERLPLLLGYAGLLPMAAVLAGQWFLPQYTSQLLYLAMLYVSAIFAFLGGIQWGLSLQLSETHLDGSTQRLLVSVLPALVAVIALAIPHVFGCLLLGLGLWALLFFEWTNRQSLKHPAWYLPLRINLTVLLSGSLAASLWLA
jgi:hypothetical protein